MWFFLLLLYFYFFFLENSCNFLLQLEKTCPRIAHFQEELDSVLAHISVNDLTPHFHLSLEFILKSILHTPVQWPVFERVPLDIGNAVQLMKHKTVWWRSSGVFLQLNYIYWHLKKVKRNISFFCEIQCFRQVTKALCDAIMTRMLSLSCKFGQEYVSASKRGGDSKQRSFVTNGAGW